MTDKFKNAPLLTVITINRNNAQELKKTIKSVFTVFHDFNDNEVEYIIIDGASTDSSVQIIKEALNTDDGKRYIKYWISEQDTGIYNAMNKGLLQAKGLFVNIMNSGDCFIPYSLSGLKQIIIQNPESILYGGMENTKNGEYIGKVYAPLYTCLQNVGLCHQTVFIPKSLHNKYGKYDESFKICADYDFLAKLFVNNEKFVYLHKLIATYDMSGVSATQDKIRELELDIIHNKYKLNTKSNKIDILKTIRRIVRYLCPYWILYIFNKI